MADATHYLDAPPRRSPRRGGIRSVAEFRTAPNRFGLGGIIEYTSPGCGLAVGDIELCYPSPADPQPEKTRSGIDTLSGIGPVFGIYAGIECYLGGSDFESDARRLLEMGADRAVEEAFNTWLQGNAADGDADSVAEAIALAENQADGEYPGLPVLILNRGDAQRAFTARALEGDGTGNLWTASGTPVLASERIAVNTVTATGGITVLEGAVITGRADRLELNKEFAIAEQVFGIAVDCDYVARYTVTI